MKRELKKGEEVVKSLVHKLTLKLFQAGSDEINYKILIILPKKSKELENELTLPQSTVSKKVNRLADAGLVILNKKGREIVLSELGKGFVEEIEETKKQVIKNLAKLI